MLTLLRNTGIDQLPLATFATMLEALGFREGEAFPQRDESGRPSVGVYIPVDVYMPQDIEGMEILNNSMLRELAMIASFGRWTNSRREE